MEMFLNKSIRKLRQPIEEYSFCTCLPNSPGPKRCQGSWEEVGRAESLGFYPGEGVGERHCQVMQLRVRCVQRVPQSSPCLGCRALGGCCVHAQNQPFVVAWGLGAVLVLEVFRFITHRVSCSLAPCCQSSLRTNFKPMLQGTGLLRSLATSIFWQWPATAIVHIFIFFLHNLILRGDLL